MASTSALENRDRPHLSLLINEVCPYFLAPWRHLGALGFALFWVLAASGIYLYIRFDTSVEELAWDDAAGTWTVHVRHRDGKTYFVLNDSDAFRAGVARLLAEVQRIKSEGDYQAARELFETYGVHFDPDLRDEVVARVDHLKLPSYTGFVMPRLEPVSDGSGTITDVKISYPCDLTTQMLEYSRSDDNQR